MISTKADRSAHGCRHLDQVNGASSVGNEHEVAKKMQKWLRSLWCRVGQFMWGGVLNSMYCVVDFRPMPLRGNSWMAVVRRVEKPSILIDICGKYRLVELWGLRSWRIGSDVCYLTLFVDILWGRWSSGIDTLARYFPSFQNSLLPHPNHPKLTKTFSIPRSLKNENWFENGSYSVMQKIWFS